MKKLWDLILNGYIPIRGMKPDTKTGIVPIGKISIKLLVLVLVISVILCKYLS